jgi:hypothetical protein
MTKYAAFGTSLGCGLAQIETATVIGTIVNPGNASVTVTCAGMTGSGSAINVAVLAADTAAIVGGKIRAVLAVNANILTKFHVSGGGTNVVLTRTIAAANDNTMNIAIANGTCSGLTAAPTSTNTQAGSTYVVIAQVQNFGGPKLSTDSIDVIQRAVGKNQLPLFSALARWRWILFTTRLPLRIRAY